MRQWSDGKAFVGVVPANTTIHSGFFYRLSGVLGMAMESLVTGAGETGRVTLEFDHKEYELVASEITAADAFNLGENVYWNNATQRFTTTATGNARFGVVSAPKEANGTVHVIRTHFE